MILVINAGSSNIKFAVYELDKLQQLFRKQVATLKDLYNWLHTQKDFVITAVGHRIVHGGKKFFAPVMLNKQIIAELREFIPLAPLHQPHNLAAVEFFLDHFPQLPQIACFDTAFHRTQIELAKEFAIPAELTQAGVIRYGFHGLSYEYIASVLEAKIGQVARKKIIVAHLGNGASMCAMENLRSVATTMSFSALDGLMMGTRSGNIDPGVLLYLLQEKQYSNTELSELLYHQCGLFGVSGISNDVSVLLASANTSAQHALELFCFRAAQEFCKLLAPLKGCDALIFTGGIGENAAPIREKICGWLEWLGKIIVAVVPTDEEYIIAKHVWEMENVWK